MPTDMGPVSASDQHDTIVENKSFRFTDLAPELRNRVYSYYLHDAGSEGLDLARFKPPTITRASKQLRSESLPIMFTECDFYVNVASNLVDHSQTREIFQRYTRVGTHPGRVRRSGVLGIKKVIKQLLRDAEQRVAVRNITFVIHETGTVVPNWSADHVVESLTLRWNRNMMETVEAPGPVRARLTQTEWDLSWVLKLAKARAERISAEEGFKGFTLKDLEKIANAFRLDMTPQNAYDVRN